MDFTVSNMSAMIAHVPTFSWMQFAKMEIVLNLNMQRAVESRASGPGSTKTQLKFHQLEERKDDRVTVESLLREGILCIEATQASNPIWVAPGPRQECETSFVNCSHVDCNVGWKRPTENLFLFKTGCYIHHTRMGLPMIWERRVKN